MKGYDALSEPEGIISFDPGAFKDLRKSEEWKYDPIEKVEEFLKPFQPSLCASVRLDGREAEEGKAGKLLSPKDKVEAQAFSTLRRRFRIEIPEGDSRIEVENNGEKDSLLLSLEIRAGQESNVLLTFEGSGKGIYFLDVEAEEESKAYLTVLCRGEGEKFVYDSTRIASGARVKRNLLCMGGKFTRYSSRAFFSGPHAEAEMNGIYFIHGDGFAETRVRVAHAFPDCKSRVSYRGALLGGMARSAWVGESIIGKNGKGSDSYELNKNFVLTPGAKSFSEPQLEIKNGDILAAGHSSSVGYFDPNQIFYLRSRGIGEEEAKEMIVSGFFEELLSQMGSSEAKGEFEQFCKRIGGFNGSQA